MCIKAGFTTSEKLNNQIKAWCNQSNEQKINKPRKETNNGKQYGK